jgi:hypothetical protein
MCELEEKNFQYSSEFKKNWRLRWLDSLVELSNAEFQQRWIDRRIGVPSWTYIEFMCRYFDDCLVDEGYDNSIEEGFLSKEEYECIKDFHKSLEKYQAPISDYDGESILKDPAWLKIRDLGGRSLENLKKIIVDPEEIETFSMQLPPLSDACFTWPKSPTKLRVFFAKLRGNDLFYFFFKIYIKFIKLTKFVVIAIIVYTVMKYIELR